MLIVVCHEKMRSIDLFYNNGIYSVGLDGNNNKIERAVGSVHITKLYLGGKDGKHLSSNIFADCFCS